MFCVRMCKCLHDRSLASSFVLSAVALEGVGVGALNSTVGNLARLMTERVGCRTNYVRFPAKHRHAFCGVATLAAAAAQAGTKHALCANHSCTLLLFELCLAPVLVTQATFCSCQSLPITCFSCFSHFLLWLEFISHDL